MNEKKVLFSVHDYDFEGDVLERGIFLHFGQTRIKVAETLAEFKEVASAISEMADEIKENYLGILTAQ